MSMRVRDLQQYLSKFTDGTKGTGVSNAHVYIETQDGHLEEIRKIIPNHFLLVPGVGAQGGSLKDVVENGMNKECGLIVNSSRSIIYAGSTLDFAIKSREAASSLQQQMASYLS